MGSVKWRVFLFFVEKRGANFFNIRRIAVLPFEMPIKKRQREGFSEAIKNKVLLWADRHCCLCKRSCGVNIEVHHIIPVAKRGKNDLDNAIPLCYECHGLVEQYNKNHPRGNRYKVEELKSRREQIYEEFTKHLVPPIHYEITQSLPNGEKRKFPDVGFILEHKGSFFPVKVKIVLKIGDAGKRISGHYSGNKLWHMNPHFSVWGHFRIPEKYKDNNPLKIKVFAFIIDQYEREHPYLPFEFVYVKEGNYWYAEP